MRISGIAVKSHSAVRPARAIVFFIVLLAGAAFWALIDSALATPWKMTCASVLLIYSVVSVRRWLHPDMVRIGWNRGRLVAFDRKSRSRFYTIRGRPFISPLYLGLPLINESGRRVRLGLFSSQVDTDFWRETLVRLRQRPMN